MCDNMDHGMTHNTDHDLSHSTDRDMGHNESNIQDQPKMDITQDVTNNECDLSHNVSQNDSSHTPSKMEMKVEVIEQKVNPWDVTSVEAFLYYNCPECDVKAKDCKVFMSHALECHQLARDSLPQLEQEPLYIKPEINFEEDDDQDFVEDPNWDYDIEDQPLFRCDICDYTCDSSSKLKSHRKTEHSVTKSEKVYECDKCDYKGVAARHLKRHKLLQHSDVTVTCDICTAEFKNGDALKKHKKMRHSEEKPYKCDMCDYKAKTGWQVKAHKQKAHEKSKPNVSIVIP